MKCYEITLFNDHNEIVLQEFVMCANLQEAKNRARVKLAVYETGDGVHKRRGIVHVYNCQAETGQMYRMKKPLGPYGELWGWVYDHNRYS